ncbi:MAG: D-alanyl-D-alanine carboxypeptidase DacF precursor [Firmicutes bacterium ADurb.Bin182]|nr:MAG: D-alanyl-D-alanine carboxypeptidase DacF precursor [Firmicutes bacterium ADurb.Bin182]
MKYALSGMMRFTAAALCLFCTLSVFCSAKAAKTDVIITNSAKAYLLADAPSMQPIVEFNSQEPVDAAGLSRLPALLIICESVDKGEILPDSMIRVSDNAASIKGPTAFLEANENISVQQLLKSAVMISAGDSTYALAQHLSGTEQAFVQKMNARLSELGINKEYSRIIDSNIKLSANDLAVIGKELMKSPSFTMYSNVYMDDLTHEDARYTELVNPNKMINTYAGCFGLSTGSSSGAGYCGVFCAKRGESVMLCVVAGANNSKERFAIASELLDYGFANYKSEVLLNEGDVAVENIEVKGGTQRYINLVAKKDAALLLNKNENAPEAKINVPEYLTAPIRAGETLGTLDYFDANGNTVMSVELVSQVSVEQAGIADYFMMVLMNWVRM